MIFGAQGSVKKHQWLYSYHDDVDQNGSMSSLLEPSPKFWWLEFQIISNHLTCCGFIMVYPSFPNLLNQPFPNPPARRRAQAQPGASACNARVVWRSPGVPAALHRGDEWVVAGQSGQKVLVGGLEHVWFSHICGMSSSQLTFIFLYIFQRRWNHQLEVGGLMSGWFNLQKWSFNNGWWWWMVINGDYHLLMKYWGSLTIWWFNGSKDCDLMVI